MKLSKASPSVFEGAFLWIVLMTCDEMTTMIAPDCLQQADCVSWRRDMIHTVQRPKTHLAPKAPRWTSCLGVCLPAHSFAIRLRCLRAACLPATAL